MVHVVLGNHQSFLISLSFVVTLSSASAYAMVTQAPVRHMSAAIVLFHLHLRWDLRIMQFRNLAPAHLVILLLVLFVVISPHLNNLFLWSSLHFNIMFSNTLFCILFLTPVTNSPYMSWSYSLITRPAPRAFTSAPQNPA